MSRYIPMPAYPDMMPVDISFVFRSEKPAGKHGFLRVDGEDMRFEDGTLAKFWGVNFNGGACFPDKDYAKKVARRLAQAGCNIVRFHQLDAEWDTPNIFAYTKGERVATTRKLDECSLDALDYLVYCLKEEGIYCYLDLITYRKFKEGDDVPQAELLLDSAKPWSIVDPHLIELQKEFATQLWCHHNPYTGLAYKDDPVFVMTEVTNECDLFTDTSSGRVEYEPATYYIQQFRTFFRDWLAENGMEYDWQNCPLYSRDEPLVLFKMHLTKKYYRAIYDHLRSIGVRIPIAGTNWHQPYAAFFKAHEDMDFADGHHYYGDNRWANNQRISRQRSITAEGTVFPSLAKIKLAGKPMFVSEWDMAWPNSYRAESPIYHAAVGALQNWTGFAIHTYAYTSRVDKHDILGKELSSPVAGVPYREGVFTVWNDPAKFGLFYHAALILRRGDVSPANKKLAISSTDMTKSDLWAYVGATEQHRVGTVFTDELPAGYDELIHDTDNVPHPDKKRITSDNGQLWRMLSRQIGAVDTQRTKVVYGQLGRSNIVPSHMKEPTDSIDLDGMSVTSATDFGVIALSSLTDAPIESSDNMLLTAIGRARNTDAQFDGDKLLSWGHSPILAEVIEAEISIRTQHGRRLKVWGINAEGFYCGLMPTTYEDGVLTFRIGNQNNPACYYLIVKE